MNLLCSFTSLTCSHWMDLNGIGRIDWLSWLNWLNWDDWVDWFNWTELMLLIDRIELIELKWLSWLGWNDWPSWNVYVILPQYKSSSTIQSRNRHMAVPEWTHMLKISIPGSWHDIFLQLFCSKLIRPHFDDMILQTKSCPVCPPSPCCETFFMVVSAHSASPASPFSRMTQ